MDTTLLTSIDAAYSSIGRHENILAEDLVPARSESRGHWSMVALAAVPALWIDLVILARAFDRLWVSAAAVIGQSFVVLAGAVLLRKAAAGRLFSTSKGNRTAGHVLGAMLLLPYTVFAEQHRHDRLAARRVDGSSWALDGKASTGFAVDATASRIGGYRSWHEAARILAGEAHTETHSRVQIRSALVSVVACAWMLTVAVVGFRFDAELWLTSWLLPLVAGTTLATAVGTVTRRRLRRLDRTANAFEVVATRPPQEILPAARSWVMSAGS